MAGSVFRFQDSRGGDLCVVRGESVFPHIKSKPVKQWKPDQGIWQTLMWHSGPSACGHSVL